jgi:hypothetical protein
MNKLLIIILLFASTQTLSYQERGTNGVAETVFTSVAFYYGDKYIALRDLMDKECNTLISLIQDTCRRDNFDNYYYQSSIIKEGIIELQDKINNPKIYNEFSTDEFPIALRNYVRDLSAVVDALVNMTDFLSELSHSMVDTGYSPLELKAEQSPLELSEKLKYLLELWDEFTLLYSEENALLQDVQLSADILSSMTRN